MNKHFNRRLLLRGLGGACVAAPFLGSLGSRGARAQSLQPPRRLIIMFTHYGCVTSRFFPTKSHGALTEADLAPTTLKHLAPYVDKLLLPRGIRAMNQWSLEVDLGQGNDSHYHVGSFFTCQPLSPNQDDPLSFDTATLFPPRPIGPSLDHVMAQQLSADGTPLLIAVGNNYDTASSAISYSASETQYRGWSASKVFSTLTGLFRGGVNSSSDTYQAARGKSIIDLVRGDLDSLQRIDMSQADRTKLEAWKALLDDTGRAIRGCNTDTAAGLGLSEASVAEATRGTADSDVLTHRLEGTSIDGADLHSNLAVLAALCNANPVIVLKYPATYLYRGLGLTTEAHGLSHRIGTAGMGGDCLPGVIDMLLSIDDYHARKLAHLANMLRSFEEGDATLLDNTATVWFQEQSDGAAHNLNNLPIVQLGSAGGYFKTGSAVNVEDGSATLTPGNSELECTASTTDKINGVDQKTGTDNALANAPINKYFCNLMNALGVKAGADGFPAPGGVAEVTSFGRYDRTQDFVGGTKNPPLIHDPGEFTALRR